MNEKQYNKMIEKHFETKWITNGLAIMFAISITIIISLAACDTGTSYPGGNRGAPDDLVGVGTRATSCEIAAAATGIDPCAVTESASQ